MTSRALEIPVQNPTSLFTELKTGIGHAPNHTTDTVAIGKSVAKIFKRGLVLASLMLFAFAASAQPPVPQPPQTYIDTTFAAPGGAKWNAHTVAELKKALDSAVPGDTIVLDAGATYQGNFTLPVKANPNNKWIYIVGSALSSLPAAGTRVNPASDAAKMPKVVTANTTAAFTIPPGGNHYRLVGLEIYSASTAGGSSSQSPYSQMLVYGASVPNQPLVDSITVDRCYIHGSATVDVRQGVTANGSNFAIIDSYISEIHQSTNDSQAILAYYSPGPIKIVNNYLEATGENVMFGGAGGYTNPFVPSDLEIRGNYFFKPLTWAKSGAGGTIPPGNQWAVKNIFECKSCRRLLFDGNVLENVWVSAQMGFAIVLTPRTSSTGMNSVVDDVMISNNILKNVSSGFNATEYDDACLPANGCSVIGEARRVKFYNNVILLGDMTQSGYTGGYGWGGIIFHHMLDFVFQHNTVVAPPNLGYCKAPVYFETSGTGAANPPVPRTHNVWILDNVFCRQLMGPYGTVGQFPYVLTDYMGDPSPVEPRLFGNVFYAPPGDKAYSLPPHNYVSTVPLTYVNPVGGNYQLNVPNWTDTSDNKVAGVNNSVTVTTPLRASPIQRK